MNVQVAANKRNELELRCVPLLRSSLIRSYVHVGAKQCLPLLSLIFSALFIFCIQFAQLNPLCNLLDFNTYYLLLACGLIFFRIWVFLAGAFIYSFSFVNSMNSLVEAIFSYCPIFLFISMGYNLRIAHFVISSFTYVDLRRFQFNFKIQPKCGSTIALCRRKQRCLAYGNMVSSSALGQSSRSWPLAK